MNGSVTGVAKQAKARRNESAFSRKRSCTARRHGLLAAVLLVCGGGAYAQTVAFAGVQTVLPATFGVPSGVAVDSSGDLFISDSINNQVVEVSSQGIQTVLPAVGLGLPTGVAVDALGDIFIADTSNSRVLELPAGGGAQITVGTGLSRPEGVALDAAGDVFIADTFNNRVVEVPAGGGAQFTLATGLNLPQGVAVDSTGNIFIADTQNNQVVEVPVGGLQTVLFASLNGPQGIAVDGAGNLFIADTNDEQVLKLPSGCASATCATTVGSGLFTPVAVALDRAGDVFIANDGTERVIEVETLAVNFGSINVCPANQTTPAPCNNTLTLNYNISGAGTLGALVPTGGGDFALAAGSTCTGAVSTGPCTVNVTFAPLFTGLRRGGIEVTNADNQPLAGTALSGIGVGPQIGFSPSGLTTIPDNGAVPYGIAVDDAGNVFASDDSSLVLELPANGGVPFAVGTGLAAPFGLATDGFGDVFIADSGNNRVVEVTPAGVQTTVGTGLAGPQGVWVDRIGNVYIADTGNNRVVEVPANGGRQITVPATGLLGPYGVGVDPFGNIYIADTSNSRVVELPVGGGPQTTVGSGFSAPFAVAFDAAGDVLVADSQLYQVPVGGGAPITLDLGFHVSTGVAVNGAGGILNADETVLLLQRVQPPSLNFQATAVGTTSSDSPQSVEIQNIGNAPLLFSGLAVGTNFAQVAGSGTPPDCTGDLSLAVDASCNLSIDFTPVTAGAVQTAVSLTDNSLNGNPTTHSIPVTNNGGAIATAVAMTVTGPLPSPISPGQTGTFTVTEVDANGNVVAGDDNLVTLSLTGVQVNSYELPLTNGQGTLQIVLTSPGALSLAATDASNSLTATDNFTVSSPVVTTAVISSISPTSVTVGSPDLTLNLTGNFTGLIGSETEFVCVNGAAGTDPLPIAGSNTAISATIPGRFFAAAGTLQIYIGDIECGTRYSNSVPFTVANVLAPTTATLTATPSPVAYGKPVTLSATVAQTTPTAPLPVTPGEVVFCIAGTAVCNSQFNAGSAQLNAAGVASLSVYPGAVGVHTYAAVFVGTATAAIAFTEPVSVTVTGTYPTTTTLSAIGDPGSYTLTSTVVGQGTTALTPGGSVSIIDQTNGNAVLGSATLGTTGTPAQTLVASAASPLAVGTRPYAVATGDFDGNGTTDFAVENYGSNTVSVFLGNGDGTFKAQVTYPVGDEPEGIAAVDLNGDGKLDLVVTNTADDTVGVLLGNGDGTFQTQVAYSAGAEAAGIVVADFNHDGKPDIATSNFAGGNVSILLGVGDGTFQDQVTYAVGNTPRTLAFGDFNGDGNIDLAVANEGDGTVGILIGDGDGTFQPQVTYPSGGAPQGVAVADFNGDGKQDLALGGSGDNTVKILIGNGDGTFQAVTTYTAGNTPLGVVTADFNGDGKTDIAVENFGDATESILLGNGNGTFQAQTVFPTGTTPYAAAVGDFNGDGYPDLVISNFGSANETVLLDQLTSTVTGVLTPVAVTGAAGNHSVVATYPSDTNFTGSTSPAITLVELGISAPTITSLTPNTAIVGSAATVVTITGTQFVAGAAVTVNGTSQAATFVSATQLTTTLTAAQLSTVATLSLAVVNPDTGTSNAAVFTVTAPAVSAPTITSLSPNSAYVGSGATVVTITGTQFISGAAVTVNGTSQTATFVSATTLTTTLTAAQLSTVGTLSLGVVNPDGGTSAAAAFAVLQLPLQFTPASLAFGNQTVGLPSAPQVVTVTNSTAAPVAITAIALYLGVNPGDFAQTNNCPTTLGAGANCQITIIFTPGGVGPKSAGLQVSDDTALPNESVNMTGTGTGGILQVNPGNLKTIAGNGTAGYSGDGGAATLAELNDPDGVNFDAAGNMYIADVLNSVIRKVDTAGNITTVAGNGTAGFSGDGGLATAAQLHGPFGVVPDSAGNLYIEDTLNARIRKVDTTGKITTIAGNGTFGFSGDNGPATAAEVAEVQGGRFDAAGNFYVAQCGPGAIRKIDTAGIITTVAGNGTDGFSGDGGLATSAQLNCPSGVAIDAAGNLFIADYLNYRIRKVNAGGIITTIAGTGTPGFTGDGGPALTAEINLPNDVDLDAAGDVLIADSGNNRIRKIDTTGVISTVVGGLNNAGSAGINAPSALALDTAGNIYFSDSGNNAIREVFPAGALAFPATEIGTPAADLTVTLSNIGNLPVTIASEASFVLSGNAADFSLAGGSCLAGATLAANGGSCTLQIGFTPTALGTRTLTVSITDDAVYSPQTFSISGTGVTAPAVVLSAISPTGAIAGAASTTVTATGANFTATSVLNFNAAPLVTTFVSATQLTAVVPAALITAVGTASITVTDPLSDSTSAPAVFSIVPSGLGVTFSAPSANPGEQPTLNFALTQAYPAALTGTMTLTFTPDTGNPDNPQVQLASTSTDVTVAPGGRTLTFPLAANSTATPVVMVQVGNVSGTITVTLQLTAAGVNVTPPSVVPVTIVVPRVAPTITSVSFTTSGNTLTVLVTGFSTTREIQSANFSFVPASGATLFEKSITVPATTLFTTWYTTPTSAQYGSAFTYTQTFTLSGNASVVAGVGATLTNSVGTSSEVTAP